MNLKEFCIHRSTNHKPRSLKQLKGNLCSDRTRVPLQQLGNLLNAAKHNVCCAPCLHCGAKRHSDIAFGRIRSNQFRALCCNLKNKSGLRLVRTCAYNKYMHIPAVPNRYMQLSAAPQPPQYTCISQRPPQPLHTPLSGPQPLQCSSHRSLNRHIVSLIVLPTSLLLSFSAQVPKREQHYLAAPPLPLDSFAA